MRTCSPRSSSLKGAAISEMPSATSRGAGFSTAQPLISGASLGSS